MALQVIGVHRRAASQGIYGGPQYLTALVANGVEWVRTGVDWIDIEQVPGQYRFDHFQVQNLEHAKDAGLKVLLNIHRKHPEYDGGEYPYSPEGTAAYARWVKAVVDHFEIDAIEVANEPNDAGGTFWDSDEPHEERAAAIIAQVKAIRALLPDITIVLGGVHSTAAGFVSLLAPAFPFVDALSMHPYTSQPMRFMHDMRIWRERTGWYGDVWITEIGSKRPEPGFIRNWLAAASAAGVVGFIAYEWAEPIADDYALFDYTDTDGNGRLLQTGQEFFERDWHQDIVEVEGAPGVFRTADGDEIETHPYRGVFFVWGRDVLDPNRCRIIMRHHPDHDDPTLMEGYGGQEINGAPWSPHLRSRADRSLPRATGTKFMVENHQAEVRIPMRGHTFVSGSLNGGPLPNDFEHDTEAVELVFRFDGKVHPRNDFALIINAEPPAVAPVVAAKVVDGEGLSGEARITLDAGAVIVDMQSDVQWVIDRGKADHVTLLIYDHTPGRRVFGLQPEDVVVCEEGCEVRSYAGWSEISTARGKIAFPGIDVEPLVEEG